MTTINIQLQINSIKYNDGCGENHRNCIECDRLTPKRYYALRARWVKVDQFPLSSSEEISDTEEPSSRKNRLNSGSNYSGPDLRMIICTYCYRDSNSIWKNAIKDIEVEDGDIGDD